MHIMYYGYDYDIYIYIYIPCGSKYLLSRYLDPPGTIVVFQRNTSLVPYNNHVSGWQDNVRCCYRIQGTGCFQIPRHSMYEISAYIDPLFNHPNVAANICQSHGASRRTSRVNFTSKCLRSLPRQETKPPVRWPSAGPGRVCTGLPVHGISISSVLFIDTQTLHVWNICSY